MSKHDPSIENEPHLQPGGWRLDDSEAKAARTIEQAQQRQSIDDVIHESVWHEPAYSPELAGRVPQEGLIYSQWLAWRTATTSSAFSWFVSIGAAALVGPFAILGVFLNAPSTASWFAPLQVILIGPVSEELMKIAIPLWIVERRPYWFKSGLQISLCVTFAGLTFSAVENVFYLGDQLFDWNQILTRWRWTVCVSLHTVCCWLSGWGLMRIWSATHRSAAPPKIELGVPLFTTAIIVHGAYNTFALFFEMIAEPF